MLCNLVGFSKYVVSGWNFYDTILLFVKNKITLIMDSKIKTSVNEAVMVYLLDSYIRS